MLGAGDGESLFIGRPLSSQDMIEQRRSPREQRTPIEAHEGSWRALLLSSSGGPINEVGYNTDYRISLGDGNDTNNNVEADTNNNVEADSNEDTSIFSLIKQQFGQHELIELMTACVGYCRRSYCPRRVAPMTSMHACLSSSMISRNGLKTKF